MSGRLRLVGATAGLRAQAVLFIPVGLVSCAPGYGRQDSLTPAVAGVVLFAVSCWGYLRSRGPSWYGERLERPAGPPAAAELVDREQEFDLLSRSLTVPLTVALAAGLLVAWATGLLLGAALVGLGVGMAWRSRWLAAQERRLGGRLVCALSPVRVAADDPNLAVYRDAPHWIVRDARS